MVKRTLTPEEALECQADEILDLDRKATLAAEGLQHGTIHGILSHDQLELRQRREVLNHNGFPESALYSGIYHRTYNPEIGKRKPRVDPWGEIEFDVRIGMGGPHVGWSWDLIGPRRDPAFAIPPRQDCYHHLTRYQRCRIRALLRKVPSSRLDARTVLRNYLALQYGVPPWVIVRCELSRGKKDPVEE